MKALKKTAALITCAGLLCSCSAQIEEKSVTASCEAVQAWNETYTIPLRDFPDREKAAVTPEITKNCKADPENIAAGEKLDSFLEDTAKENNAVGMSVAVFKDGEVIHTFNYGWQYREAGIKASDETVWRLASVSKLVSAIVLMTMYDDGIITPESDLRAITGLPYNNPYSDEPIRLWHLLTHTAGIIDTGTYSMGRKNYYTTEYILSGACGGCVPGTSYSYSNFGAGTIGSVVEILTGEFFHNYAEQKVFAPLGMNAAYGADKLKDIEAAAAIYYEGEINCIPQYWDRMSYVWEKFGLGNSYVSAQCELLMTSADLAKMGIILSGDGTVDGTRILSQKAVDLINKTWYEKADFDMGLIVRKYNGNLVKGRTIYGHPGQSMGKVCGLYYDPTDRTGAAITTNGCNLGLSASGNGVYAILDSAINKVYDVYF